jgi:hypothetical protein
MTRKRLTPQDFRYGFCYWMAIALNRTFGHPIGALIVDLPRGGRHIVHAYCIGDDGRPYDAVGDYPVDRMNSDYLEDKRRWTAFEHLTFESDGEFLAAVVDTAASTGHPEIFADMAWTDEMIRLAQDHLSEFFAERLAPGPRF